MTDGTPFGGVEATEYPVIEGGVYNATLTRFSGLLQGIKDQPASVEGPPPRAWKLPAGSPVSPTLLT